MIPFVLLVALMTVGFRQSHQAWAWTPPSASMPRGTGTSSLSLLRMSPSTSSLIEEQPSSPEVPAATTTRATRTNVTATSKSANDYTHSFTTNLEARRRELEEINGAVEEISRNTMEPAIISLGATKAFHKENDHLEQALAIAATSTKAMFQAMRFVASETVHVIQSFDAKTTTFVNKKHANSRAEEPITTYGEAFAKIAKSGRGVLKLMDFVRESLVAPRVAMSEVTTAASSSPQATKVRGTHRVREMPKSISATLAVVRGVDTPLMTSSTAPASTTSNAVTASQVIYRPTISLSPAEAKTVWGYTGEKEEESVSLQHHLQDMAIRVGQWTEHAFATIVTQHLTRDFDPVTDDEEGLQRKHDFAPYHQRQQQNSKTAEATGPGPTYFLNVHDTETALPKASQRYRPRIMEAQNNVFFFAN